MNKFPKDGTSVTQLKTYVVCVRKFFLRYILGYKPDTKEKPLIIGNKGHAVLERYFKTGELPDKGQMLFGDDFAAPIGRIALSMINMEMPAPGTYEVEESFTHRVPEGVTYIGKIDLKGFESENILHIIDHKITSDPEKYALGKEEMRSDLQVILYSKVAFDLNPTVSTLKFTLNYGSSKGVLKVAKTVSVYLTKSKTEESYRELVLPLALEIQELRRWYERALSDKQRLWQLLPPNTDSCTMYYRDCPYKEQFCKLTKAEKLKGIMTMGTSNMGVQALLNAARNLNQGQAQAQQGAQGYGQAPQGYAPPPQQVMSFPQNQPGMAQQPPRHSQDVVNPPLYANSGPPPQYAQAHQVLPTQAQVQAQVQQAHQVQQVYAQPPATSQQGVEPDVDLIVLRVIKKLAEILGSL